MQEQGLVLGRLESEEPLDEGRNKLVKTLVMCTDLFVVLEAREVLEAEAMVEQQQLEELVEAEPHTIQVIFQE